MDKMEQRRTRESVCLFVIVAKGVPPLLFVCMMVTTRIVWLQRSVYTLTYSIPTRFCAFISISISLNT